MMIILLVFVSLHIGICLFPMQLAKPVYCSFLSVSEAIIFLSIVVEGK